MPKLYMIGGPNGAGKTTAAMSLLPKLLNCYEYINAGSIAAALSPFAPETTAIQAGRLMLERIQDLANQKKNFAFETTMASRSFLSLLKSYKKNDYQVSVIFFWLQNPNLALERVRERVSNGGHHIPDDVVLRRYQRCKYNFLNFYISIADDWVLYDNSLNKPYLVAEKKAECSVRIFNKDVWDKFESEL